MSHAPAGSIPAGDMARIARPLANFMVAHDAGSIDSFAPANSPLRGFVYVARSRGSIPVGDTVRYARGLANVRIAQSEGSIDSRSSRTLAPSGLRLCRP